MPSIDNKKKTQQNKLLYIFLTTFFVTLLTMIYLATALTPKIDIDLTPGNSTNEEAARRDIDSRLKDIQQSELEPQRIQEEESESDLVAQLKKMKEETIAKQLDKEEIEIEDDEDPIKPLTQVKKPQLASPEYKRQTQTQATQPTPSPQPVVTSKMAKVYVGRYADFEQAIKVQDALVKASLASSPFIKNIGGYYVIQVGSFANHQTAQNVAENLITNGYSARMVLE